MYECSMAIEHWSLSIDINIWRGTLKIIILNRKKIGIIVIIIGLMISLLGVSKGFDKKLQTAVLVQNNIKFLTEYKALNGRISYKIPEGWTTSEKKFGGNEIVYHNDFQSPDAIIHGFMQVWKSKQELKKFLEDSKKISEKQNQVKDYKIDETIIKGNNAYVVQYLINTSGENWYKAYEYYIEGKGEFYRFSFFMRNVNFKEPYRAIFESIVQTFKLNSI